MALNAKKVKATKSGTAQALIKKGNHFARVAQVIDLGLQPRKAWKGKAKSNVNQLWVTYELVNLFMLDEDGNEEKDRPRWISEKMNLFSLSQDNATSTKRMEALDEDGAIDGDWGRVGGIPCTVTITHSKDKQYANIGSISPSMEGVEVPELQKEPVIFDLEEPDMEVFEGLPDFLKELITSNLEFKNSPLERLLSGEQEESYEPDEEDDEPY